MASNFNDSGWTNSLGGNVYDQSGNSFNYNVSSSDIYNTTQQCGVYMVNGGVSIQTYIFPVQCSTTNYHNLGMPDTQDDAYIVYPGFGIQLFTGMSWTGTASNIYVNSSNQPVLFQCTGNDHPFPGATNIYQYGSTSNGYSVNQSNSIKIYFRNTQVVITGITNPGT